MYRNTKSKRIIISRHIVSLGYVFCSLQFNAHTSYERSNKIAWISNADGTKEKEAVKELENKKRDKKRLWKWEKMHGSDTSLVRMIEGDGASAHLLRLFDTFRTTVRLYTVYKWTIVHTLFNIQHLAICLGYWDIVYIHTMCIIYIRPMYVDCMEFLCSIYNIPCCSLLNITNEAVVWIRRFEKLRRIEHKINKT